MHPYLNDFLKTYTIGKTKIEGGKYKKTKTKTKKRY
jgi:hypothetical protein